jgi:hypothetical protein
MTLALIATLALNQSAIPRATYEPLFDGRSFEGWRGWRTAEIPKNWSVEDGTLTCTPGPGYGDIRTERTFQDFDLRFEWKVTPGGNSGVFYRIPATGRTVWQLGPEYQVLDDARAPDGKNPLTSASAAYALYPPMAKVVRPAGEWNGGRVVARGNRVEHWLNGIRVVVYEVGSPDWQARIAKSKFKDHPFARASTGHMVLQDHGSKVWFRNLRILEL